ncbi:MAG: hypothetical protein K9H16_14095 [Bacteroidales bacterium]|nr:hypothetical protein [Bacteroidales bacterium]
MNSDKMDNYFKENIDSLDHIPVPGSSLNIEAAWEKIDHKVNNRKKIVFWWYLSGVAAVVLLMITFWFLAPQNNSNTSIAQSASEKPDVKTIIVENHKLQRVPDTNQKPALAHEGLDDDIVDDEPDNLGFNRNLNMERKAGFKTLAYLPEVFQIANCSIEASILVPVKSEIASTKQKTQDLVFNRTYIIMKKPSNTDVQNELKLVVDLAMKSDQYPPPGLLSSLRK